MAVFQTADTQAEVISHLEIEAQKLKSDFIKKQEQAFGLQEDLISAKDNQLLELKETIVLSIGDTFQTQLTSNSKALQGSGNGCSSSLLDQNVLKSVVKDVVGEEDISRNMLIFRSCGGS